MVNVLTIDVDWVPSVVLQDTIDILETFDATATLFSTHEDGVTASGHERSLHPNFFQEDDLDDLETIANISELYPNARGIRSHGLYTHTSLREHYDSFDLLYESNYVMFCETGVEPFWMYPGVVQLPITFMDDLWLRRGGQREGLVETIIESRGTSVLTFHPIHIFLNTPSIQYYEKQKEHYQQPEKLREARYDGDGVRTLFKDLLRRVGSEFSQTAYEVASDFAEQNAYTDIKY